MQMLVVGKFQVRGIKTDVHIAQRANVGFAPPDVSQGEHVVGGSDMDLSPHLP
jgi:hypothetical protein